MARPPKPPPPKEVLERLVDGRDPKTGQWVTRHTYTFKKGGDPRINPGGQPKGAKLGPALLRALNRELRTKFPDGTPRRVVDQLATNIVKLALGGGLTAVSAFRAISDVTDGQKLRLEGGEEIGALGQVPTAELYQARAELMQRRAAEDDGRDGEPSQ